MKLYSDYEIIWYIIFRLIAGWAFIITVIILSIHSCGCVPHKTEGDYVIYGKQKVIILDCAGYEFQRCPKNVELDMRK